MVENLGVIFIIISDGLAWASDYFALPIFASVAILLFGLWLITWGVEVALKGEVTLINHERQRYEFFSGLPAGLWSAIFITTGMGIVFLGWLDISNHGGCKGYLKNMLNSPGGWGVILGIAGTIVTTSGVIRVLTGSASDSEKMGGLEEVGSRAAGFLRKEIVWLW